MKTVLYVIWALFELAAVAALVYTARKAKRQERLTAGWPRVQAVVTGSTAGWSGRVGGSDPSRRYFSTYQFAGPNGEIFNGTSDVPMAEIPVPGSYIEVAVNPANPHESFHQSTKEKVGIGCAIAFFAVFSLVSFWFIGIFPIG
jgi:Protein of unknown function (DUF3592)